MTPEETIFECECGCRTFELSTYGMTGNDKQAIDWIECTTCEARFNALPRPSLLDRRE